MSWRSTQSGHDAMQAWREDRASLMEHLATDNGDAPQEWCDKHHGYVDEGHTQPMASGSPYRICHGCADEARRRAAAREDYCPDCGYLMSFHIKGRCVRELGPEGARAQAGDR